MYPNRRTSFSIRVIHQRDFRVGLEEVPAILAVPRPFDDPTMQRAATLLIIVSWLELPAAPARPPRVCATLHPSVRIAQLLALALNPDSARVLKAHFCECKERQNRKTAQVA